MKPTFFVLPPSGDALKNRIQITSLGEHVVLTPVENHGNTPLAIQAELDPKLIQFYFCMDGAVEFVFHGGHYRRSLSSSQSFLLYHPDATVAHEVVLSPKARVLALFVSVKQLHEWFVEEAGELAFLNTENINQRFYAEGPVSSTLAMVIGPLFLIDPPSDTKNLFFRAKVMEILSLYFSREEEDTSEKCPFLHDEANVEKIRLAKQTILANIIDPPSLKELAREIGLNEYQLKVGFKNIYGTTVYKYLTDYRMDQARRMLDSGSYLVNEAAVEVGYSNPSHFIAAFKKKYGFTPKKYVGFVRS